MPAVHEEKLKKAFVRAINKAISDKEEFIKKDCKEHWENLIKMIL